MILHKAAANWPRADRMDQSNLTGRKPVAKPENTASVAGALIGSSPIFQQAFPTFPRNPVHTEPRLRPPAWLRF
ncbi:MAG: hypothetical protein CMO80_23690 [Verrucomicrobiales bacterium]|nr:hypothetical protein [Verrucomicrobiales bacterium]